MQINGIDMSHFRRSLEQPMNADQQKALEYIYMMLQDVERAGLPVENVLEECTGGDWQHICFPTTSEHTFNNAIVQAGFVKCLDVYDEKDLDFWERLKRGETMTSHTHTGFTKRKH